MAHRKVQFQLGLEAATGDVRVYVRLLFDPPLTDEAIRAICHKVADEFGAALTCLSSDGVSIRYEVESLFYKTLHGKADLRRRLRAILGGMGYEELNPRPRKGK